MNRALPKRLQRTRITLLEQLEPRLLLSDVNFAPEVPYTTPATVISVATADFNGDTLQDMAVVNQSAGTLGILMGTGGGAFGAEVDYQTGSSPSAVVVGDFNHDDHPDLAVTNTKGGTISVFLNNGNGTFAAAVTYTVGLHPVAIVAGDFAGNGLVDLAVVNNGNNSVSILMNTGTGTFTPAVTYAAGAGPLGIVAAPFYSGAVPDLAIADFNNNQVAILRNNGNGTFAAPVFYNVGSEPRTLVAGDFANNGRLDIAVANSGSNTIGVLDNNGDGAFATMVTYATDSTPLSVTTADFTGDGYLDIAVAEFNNNTVSVLANNGDGTFAAAVDFPTGVQPSVVTAADLNGDGKPDLIVGNTSDLTVGVLLNAGVAGLVTPPGGLDQQYVTALYGDLLNRGPDSGGLNAFAAQLDAGQTAASVVTQIVTSQEYRQDLVQALYQHLLGRAADSAGLANFTAMLAGGGTDEQVAAAIYGSAEFYALQGLTVQGFLNALYEDALGRAPDSTGNTAFTAMLGAGETTQQVATAVLQSAEYRQDIAAGFYQKYLLRAPTSAETAAAVIQLGGGATDESIIVSLVTGHEYFVTRLGAVGTLNESFVNQVYEDFLGRPVDSTGLATYAPMLDANPGLAERQVVVTAIEGTLEYKTDLVQSFYQRLLGRAASTADAQTWAAKLLAGATDESVIASIIGSGEYFNDHGPTTTTFLVAVYNDLQQLPANPQAAAFVAFIAELSGGTSTLQIAQTLDTGNAYWAALLERLYVQLLGRGLDGAGQALYTAQFVAGQTDEQVAAQIAATPEFFHTV